MQSDASGYHFQRCRHKAKGKIDGVGFCGVHLRAIKRWRGYTESTNTISFPPQPAAKDLRLVELVERHIGHFNGFVDIEGHRDRAYKEIEEYVQERIKERQ